MSIFKFFENLSNNYLELLDDKEDFNIIIETAESIVQAHSNILRYRSLYFRNVLTKTIKDENNIKTINLKHVSAQQFDIIIKYIYGGIILLENQDASFIFKLMIVASELLFEELAQNLENYLIETKANWLRLNFTRIYRSSFKNKFQNLQKWCNEIAVKHPNTVFDSEDFILFQEDALVSIIRRDDLQMDELKIWNYIIKWGIAQNPSLPSGGPENWTSENFLTLKNTLKNCLPHIRYFHIPADDFVDNVEPFQAILERKLWKDLLKRAVNPNRPIVTTIIPPREVLIPKLPSRATEPFSAVINEVHAAEIASWVDNKTNGYAYSVTNNPYEFKLLLRGTRDGFTKKSFWRLCDKQANTILVIKVKGTNEILGGYNPMLWDKSINNWVYCNGTFIFSLKNGTVQSSILSRVEEPEYAFYSDSSYGPWFGDGSDLYMGKKDFNQNNECYCKRYSYEKPIRNINSKSYFSVAEYEVFQIQRKV